MDFRKQVYIVTEYIGFNHNSTAYYWASIVLYLDKFFDVTVICPGNENTKQFFKNYSIKVEFVKDFGFDKNKVVTRVLGQLIFAFMLNYKVLSSVGRGKVLVTGTNPIISVFFTSILKKFKDFRWMVICHDIFPDNLLPSKVLSEGFFFKVINKVSSLVYKSPDIVAPIGRDMGEKLSRKGVELEKIRFVSNWANHEKVFPIPKRQSPIITDLGWQDNVVFCFFGNIGRAQGISDLLDALALVRSPKARFLFIGDGSDEPKVRSFVESSGKNNSFYFGRLDLEKNNIGLNSADVAIVSLSRGMYGLGVPSKAYFSMAADKPILLISDKGSELELLLRDHNLGWFCESGKPELLSKKIEEICENYDVEKSKFSPRNTLIEKFSEKSSLEKYANLVSELHND